MSPDLVRRFRFFREHGRSWVGHAAEQAIALARAEIEGEARGLVARVVDEWEPWDGETPAPKHLVCVTMHESDERGEPIGPALASLGMVGVDDMADPFLRVVGAELMQEALDGPLAKGKPGATCETPVDALVRGHAPGPVEIRESTGDWLFLEPEVDPLRAVFARRWGR